MLGGIISIQSANLSNISLMQVNNRLRTLENQKKRLTRIEQLRKLTKTKLN